jgi:hypothetical protein
MLYDKLLEHAVTLCDLFQGPGPSALYQHPAKPTSTVHGSLHVICKSGRQMSCLNMHVQGTSKDPQSSLAETHQCDASRQTTA